MRKFSLGAMVITGVLSVAAPAMAAPAAVSYPAPTVDFGSVSSSIVIIGGTVNIYGGGFLPGATVVINNNSAPVGTAPANDQGKFVSSVTVNACGTNTLTGTGTGPSGQVTVSSTVIGSCPPGKSASAGTTTGAGTTSAGTTGASTTGAGTTVAGTTTAGTTVAGTTVAGTTTAGTASTGSAAIPAVATTVAGASTTGGTSASAGTPAPGSGTTVAGASTTGGTTASAGTPEAGSGTTVAGSTAVTPVSGGLPRTGSDVVVSGLAVGFVLVAVGAGVTVATRRRRTGSAVCCLLYT